MPDVATCAVCGVDHNIHQLARQNLPHADGEEPVSFWVCSDFHRCARNVAATADRARRGAAFTHPDMAPHLGVTDRHLALRADRMRELRREHGIPEPTVD
jgi:hypothetical protein